MFLLQLQTTTNVGQLVDCSAALIYLSIPNKLKYKLKKSHCNNSRFIDSCVSSSSYKNCITRNCRGKLILSESYNFL